MSDDTPKDPLDDDALLDDDLDLLDDLDDFDDDALLDDELDDLDEDWDDMGDNAMPTQTTGQKSFVAKYFNFIVIGIAVVFGAIFFAATFTGSPKPQPETSGVAGTSQSATSEAEPLNLSLSALRDDNDQHAAVLPYEQDIAALEDASQQTSQIDNTFEQEAEITQNLNDENDFFADLMDDAPETVSELEPNPFEAITIKNPSPTPTTADNILLPMPDFAEDNLGNPIEDMAAPAQEPLEFVATQNNDMMDNADDFGAKTDRILELEERLIELTAKLNTVVDNNLALEQELLTTLSDKEALENRLATVQDDLENVAGLKKAAEEKARAAEAKAETAAKEAQQQQVIQQRAEASVISEPPKPAPPVQAPKQAAVIQPAATKEKAVATPKAVPVQAAPAKTARAPEWIMRSAQQGRAVLANKATGDLLRINVGDKVAGFGTIQSINYSNGSWTIKGSTGQLSR